MEPQSTYLVFGGTGRTGRHFITLALARGHAVRALARRPENFGIESPNLTLIKGSISDPGILEELVHGVDCVVAMLGDAKAQRISKVNANFVKELIPAMRRHGVDRFLYQAGSATRPYKGRLQPFQWLMRNTLVRTNGLSGQHEDNEAVIEYLVERAQDIAWVVHRASIFSDGPSKGVLQRSRRRISIATFVDTAAHNYELLQDPSAVHTYDASRYAH
ncbi:putative flavin reductase [Mycobacteroides abscessus subsp. abscessus]|uniref:NAD(P)-dependent oxidoreductase n=1 Tax=Mycobacteroides abscessus TaxID=36809 RepID=UPI0009A705AE|nr:NAD(P)H-binding protein [Mycobacteroides abscessus]SKF60151.1 putative flavin reductase [Mycobacteroides abscessus subsp. abscessus]